MFKWIERFNEGCESFKNIMSLGRPSTSRGDKNIELCGPVCFRPMNGCPDNSWWAQFWKIICAHNFDLRIATEKVLCQKKKDGYSIITMLQLVCANPLFLGSKFYYNVLHLLIYQIKPNATSFYFRNANRLCGRSAGITWPISNAKRPSYRRVQLLRAPRDILSNGNENRISTK